MKNRAAEIHAGLKHPVIDGDGHWLEPVPVFLECLRRSGRRSSGRPDESALAAHSRVVPLHMVRTPTQSHPGAATGGASPARPSTRQLRCCRLC